MLRSTAVVAAVLALIGLPLGAAAALIVPVSQTRSVTASTTHAGGVPASQTFSASDFGAFDATASARSSDLVRDPSGICCGVHASMRQTSSIDDTSIVLNSSGSAYFDFTGGADGDPPPTVFSQYLFDVTFDVTAPANYFLHEYFAVTTSFGRSFGASLTDASGAELQSGFVLPLAPGRYRLESHFTATDLEAGFPDGFFSSLVDLQLTEVPEPSSAALPALGLTLLASRRPRSA